LALHAALVTGGAPHGTPTLRGEFFCKPLACENDSAKARVLRIRIGDS
jgi:hypothetical protein